jgi:hypothetical protein
MESFVYCRSMTVFMQRTSRAASVVLHRPVGFAGTYELETARVTLLKFEKQRDSRLNIQKVGRFTALSHLHEGF